MKPNTYIGIDLGTSAVKVLLVDSDGKVLNTASESYPVIYPKSGWSEQNPADWRNGAFAAIKKALNGYDPAAVKGISFGGQMHGLVMLDAADNIIRPAILWNDGRTQTETDHLNNDIGKPRLSALTANIAFAGFTAPKLLWVRDHETDNYAKIAKIMLPKDYLAYVLSGSFATDLSDASGMLLLDVARRRWSPEMCEICGVNPAWLPALHESYETIGTLAPAAAAELGLSPDVKIIAGAGDNAAAAVGTGAVADGSCNISLGTSGTIFISSEKFSVDAQNALHSFCHANGRYHLMGCTLSAASCSKWWVEDILKSGHAAEEAAIAQHLGRNEVYFLPYLMGERSPHNDTAARAAFIGMRPDTTREKFTLAVMEGVMFALKDCLDIARANGVAVTSTRICGGGAKSKIWREITANIFGMPVETLAVEEGPAYGAAMLAMVGCGEYATVAEAAAALVKTGETIHPAPALTAAYAERHAIFRKLYPALKDAFAAM